MTKGNDNNHCDSSDSGRPPEWMFEHSVTVRTPREAAWTFWTEIANWTVVDPAVEWARIDGPFVAGTRGETKPVGAPPTSWTLVTVDPQRSARIKIEAPSATVYFDWNLEDTADGGTLLTQRAMLLGEAAGYLEVLRALEEGIPAGMAKLASAIESNHSQ
jgi:hypothetical protein